MPHLARIHRRRLFSSFARTLFHRCCCCCCCPSFPRLRVVSFPLRTVLSRWPLLFLDTDTHSYTHTHTHAHTHAFSRESRANSFLSLSLLPISPSLSPPFFLFCKESKTARDEQGRYQRVQARRGRRRWRRKVRPHHPVHPVALCGKRQASALFARHSAALSTAVSTGAGCRRCDCVRAKRRAQWRVQSAGEGEGEREREEG